MSVRYEQGSLCCRPCVLSHDILSRGALRHCSRAQCDVLTISQPSESMKPRCGFRETFSSYFLLRVESEDFEHCGMDHWRPLHHGPQNELFPLIPVCPCAASSPPMKFVLFSRGGGNCTPSPAVGAPPRSAGWEESVHSLPCCGRVGGVSAELPLLCAGRCCWWGRKSQHSFLSVCSPRRTEVWRRTQGTVSWSHIRLLLRQTLFLC